MKIIFIIYVLLRFFFLNPLIILVIAFRNSNQYVESLSHIFVFFTIFLVIIYTITSIRVKKVEYIILFFFILFSLEILEERFIRTSIFQETAKSIHRAYHINLKNKSIYKDDIISKSGVFSFRFRREELTNHEFKKKEDIIKYFKIKPTILLSFRNPIRKNIAKKEILYNSIFYYEGFLSGNEKNEGYFRIVFFNLNEEIVFYYIEGKSFSSDKKFIKNISDLELEKSDKDTGWYYLIDVGWVGIRKDLCQYVDQEEYLKVFSNENPYKVNIDCRL